MQNSPAFTEQRNGSLKITGVILDYGQVLAYSATREDFGRMAKYST